MLRNILLTGAATALVASATPASAQDLTAPDYPETRSGDVVDEQFGEQVADPYRWLENDVRVDSEVADWVERQNEVTDAFLDRLPGREKLEARITQLTDYERFGLPTEKGGRYYYTRNDGLQNQSVLYVRDGLDGEPRVLIDPNTWAADGATALADYAITEDGSKLLYAIQDGGSDWRTVKVMDVATGEVMEDTIEWVKFSNLDWAKDGSGFYYSRFPATGEGETFQALNTNQQVYFHRLGTDQSEDILIYATDDRPELNHTAQVSDDGRYVIVTSSSGTDDRYEVTLIDREYPDAEPMTLVPGFENNFTYIGNLGSEFFFVTNDDAPLKRVVKTDITTNDPMWHTVIPESEQTLDGVSLVGGKLIAEYLVDAKSKIEVFGLDGTPQGEVALPGIGSAGGFGGSPEDTETFYAFSSYNRPSTVYRYDVETGESEVWAQPEVSFDPEDFVVEQKFYTSKDGTRVPMAGSTFRSPRASAPRASHGSKRAVPTPWPTSAAAANTARRGTMADVSTTSRTCSTISSRRANT